MRVVSHLLCLLLYVNAVTLFPLNNKQEEQKTVELENKDGISFATPLNFNTNKVKEDKLSTQHVTETARMTAQIINQGLRAKLTDPLNPTSKKTKKGLITWTNSRAKSLMKPSTRARRSARSFWNNPSPSWFGGHSRPSFGSSFNRPYSSHFRDDNWVHYIPELFPNLPRRNGMPTPSVVHATTPAPKTSVFIDSGFDVGYTFPNGDPLTLEPEAETLSPLL